MATAATLHELDACDSISPFYEVVDGQNVELPPMSAFAMDLGSILTIVMGSYAARSDLGRVRQEMLFNLRGVGRQRRPDVAFVSFAKWSQRKRVPRTNAWDVVPDLAVEIVSASDLAEEVAIKMHEYFRAGVRQVWIVWPDAEEIYQYDSPTSVKILARADTLDAGDVLPGFKLPLAELFEEETDDATT